VNSDIKNAFERCSPSAQSKIRMRDRLLERVQAAPAARNKTRVRRLTAAAASVLILLGGTLAALYWRQPKRPSIDPAAVSDEIKGLPVENFQLSEVELGVSMDRAPVTALSEFFQAGGVGANYVVLVKITDTQDLPPRDDEEGWSRGRQLSQGKVLQTLLGEDVPKSIPIEQYLYNAGVVACPDVSGQLLLRKGGVYLLPFIKLDGGLFDDERSGEDVWLNRSELDVMFEVDDSGRVFSHSEYPDFKRFDGQPYRVLHDAMLEITQDAQRMIAYSRLGRALRGSATLAQVKIMSNEGTQQNEDGTMQWEVYQVRVTRQADGGALPETFRLRVYSDVGATQRKDKILREGGVYLMAVSRGEEGYSVSDSSCAEILPDERLRCVESEFGNAFDDYEGKTAAPVWAAAAEAAEYMRRGEDAK